MEMALRLMAHIPDRATALVAMRQLPQGISFTDYHSLGTADALEAAFTYEDVVALMNDKRTDLAQVILANSKDFKVLDDAVHVGMPSPFARAIAANSRTPLATLVRMSRDSRAVVAKPAVSALARRCGLKVKDAPVGLELLSKVLDCPLEELPAACSEVAAEALTPTLYSVSLAAALSRPEVLPDPLIEQLVDLATADWAWRGTAQLVVALSAHPQVTAEHLLAMARSASERLGQVPSGPMAATARAALSRGSHLQESDRRWLACRLFESSPIQDKESAKLLHPDDALEFAMSTSLPWKRAAALDCPGITAQAVESLLVEVRLIVSAARTAAFGLATSVPSQLYSVLAHEHVDNVLLDKAMELRGNPQALSWLVRNPNLSRHQWAGILDSLDPEQTVRVLESVARAPSAPPELVSLALAAADPSVHTAQAMDRTFQVGPPLVGEWASHRIVEGLCENQSLSDSVVARVSLAALRSRWATSAIDARLCKVALSVLGNDGPSWQAFVSLEKDWDGSVGELLAACQSL